MSPLIFLSLMLDGVLVMNCVAFTMIVVMTLNQFVRRLLVCINLIKLQLLKIGIVSLMT